jgi:RNA polymerase sigma-70 factor (ECF subfamily)
MPITPELLATLVDAHAAVLELYARQWCDAPADAAQEAFVQLAQQSALPERVLPWLFRVTRNRALSLRRSDRRRLKHERNAATADWFEPNFAAAIDGRTAAVALERLPEEQREVIVAHLWGGLTFEEIAEVTGASSSTAHRRYAEGLNRLRQELGVTWLTEQH